jgi:hypothetical protein
LTLKNEERIEPRAVRRTIKVVLPRFASGEKSGTLLPEMPLNKFSLAGE